MNRNLLRPLIFFLIIPSVVWADYTLRKGDVIAYSIITANEIAGEAAIDVSGDITLPLIGSMRADGKSLSDFRKEVQLLYTRSAYTEVLSSGHEMLRRLTPEVVTIDIARYRPIYVMGAVTAPGEVVFSPGMIAIQAIISAGSVGSAAANDEGLQLQFDAFILRERIAQAQRDRDRLTADLARMRGDDGVLSEEEELGWLGARKAERHAQKMAYEKTVEQFRQRLAALEQQKANTDESARLDAAELEQVEVLAKKGLAQLVRITDARQALLASTGRALEVGSEMAEVELELTRLMLGRDVDRMAEISSILEGISAADANLAILHSQYRALFGLAALRSEDEEDYESGLEILIIRGQGEGARTLHAEETTPVMPGDVLKVSIKSAIAGERSSPARVGDGDQQAASGRLE